MMTGFSKQDGPVKAGEFRSDYAKERIKCIRLIRLASVSLTSLFVASKKQWAH